MRASGVYWTLTDQSFKTPGSSDLVAKTALMTTKGKIGELNFVTADNMASVIGDNMEYNGDYLGLQRMLESVPYMYVMRLNVGAAIANIYDTADATISSEAGIEEGATVEPLAQTFAIQMKTPGNPGKYYVRVLPDATTQSLPIPTVTGSDYVFELGKELDLTRLPIVVNGTRYSGALYNSDKSKMIAVVTSSGKVLAIEGDDVTQTEIGTCTKNTLTLSVATYEPDGPVLPLDAFTQDTKLYTLYSAISEDGVNFTLKNAYQFSLVETYDAYYKNVDFGDYELFIKSTTGFKYKLITDYTKMENGDNGHMATASDLKWTAFNTTPANLFVLQHIADVAVVNAFARHCEEQLCSLLFSFPDLNHYTSAAAWGVSLYNTEYAQGYWISDTEETAVGKLYIAPSVNAFLIYANLQATYGTMNYPPAGYTYGNISVSKLMETDYLLFRNDLKTNKINYQMVGPRGPVMWEQRTRYANETDLSYANSVFILRDLRSRILDYAQNFNFLYTTPTMLTIFGRGLRTILDDMSTAGFIARYALKVPTFEEAQQSGRTLKIRISVAIMQDSEEIIFDVVLNNYADVAA